jgi:DNA-binding CsgD family transcriptional regulator
VLADWPLVGRRRELELVAGVALGPDAGAVIVRGPAGVGKSRLARDVLAMAEASGVATASVIGTRAASGMAFGALVPLLVSFWGTHDVLAEAVRAAAAAVAARAGNTRLVLAVDDAHLLDASSLAVLVRLLDEPIVFVVATARTGEPTPTGLDAWVGHERVVRVELGSLSRQDVQELLLSMLDGPIDAAAYRDLWDASTGNPLFLRELVRGAIDAGTLRNDAGLWRLHGPLATPPRLAELVEARLESLDRHERGGAELLSIAEVIGVAELDAIAGAGVASRLEALAIVERIDDQRRRRVRFAHPLYGDVVRASIANTRLWSIARALADALEATGARRREDPLRVAAWRLDGGGDAKPGALLRGAREALWSFDLELAKRLASVAWTSERSPDAALILARVLSEEGGAEHAVRVLEAAAALTTTDEERAHVAMSRADILFRSLQRHDEAEAVNQAAAAAITDPSWLADLTAQRARMQVFAGQPQAALDVLASLLEVRHGRAFVEAAVVAGPALAIVGQAEDAVALADEGMAATFALGDAPEIVHPGVHLLSRVLGLMESGRLEEAVATATAGYEGSLALHSLLGQGWFALNLARVELLRGRLADAARLFAEAAGAFRTIGQEGRLRLCLGGLALAHSLRAEPALATRALVELDAIGSTADRMFEPDLDRARAWTALASGERGRAERLLRDAAASAAAAGQRALEAAALHDLARIGRAGEVAPRLARLADECQGVLVPARAAYARALADHDGRALEAAGDAFARMDAWLFAAEAFASASHAHRRARLPGRAAECERRRRDLVSRCDDPATPALQEGAELTPLTAREREVAVLAAQGLASRVIAARLAVSVRTVDNHLRHAYEKLDVTTRAELAAALRQRS